MPLHDTPHLMFDAADTASKECNIFAYPDHNFLTASIPVPRLHVYVRRLVEAGHKVSILRLLVVRVVYHMYLIPPDHVTTCSLCAFDL